MSSSKRRRQRQRETSAKQARPFHPEPVYQATVEAHGLAYGGPETHIPGPWRHRDLWYGQPGWPPTPYWMDEHMHWYAWHEGDERYYPLDDGDQPPADLLLKIVDALNTEEDRRLTPLGMRVARQREGFTPGATTLHTILDAPDGWRLGPEPQDTDGHRARVDGRHGIRSGGVTWAVVPDERAETLGTIERLDEPFYGPPEGSL